MLNLNQKIRLFWRRANARIVSFWKFFTLSTQLIKPSYLVKPSRIGCIYIEDTQSKCQAIEGRLRKTTVPFIIMFIMYAIEISAFQNRNIRNNQAYAMFVEFIEKRSKAKKKEKKKEGKESLCNFRIFSVYLLKCTHFLQLCARSDS